MTREEAIERLKQGEPFSELYDEKWETALNMAIEALKEQKIGKWILSDVQRREDIENGNYQYFCSNCLHSDIHAKTVTVPFCWYCGADMGGEENV